ncbi:MAG: cyclic nucleotide-binding domain-containing protein [Chloroflexia bacterium]|nr:cyclic nucleotide-binding domain-containing protein [Chloroflexia bacterium]
MIHPELLKQVTMFSLMPADVLERVIDLLQLQHLPAGQVLFELGDPGDEMYIIQDGYISIYMPSSDKPDEVRPIRIFGPGEFFGEMALIDQQPRSASARAREDSTVIVLKGDDFRRMLLEQPDFVLSVMSGLNNRIRYTTDFLGEVQGWVARVAEGNYDRQYTPQCGSEDRSISSLAAAFTQMCARVQQREQELRREVMQLRIEIDQAKKERQVSEIVDSDYFRSLRDKAKRLREGE